MDAVLLIDFGSTNTKVTAVDIDSATLLGTAAAFTTVGTDVGEGLENALIQLREKCGDIVFSRRYACSSAAGGLRMAASGLVPGLTAEAAKLASLGAGAKVVKVFSYEMTDEDIAELEQIKPDIFLLTGGTDGGNTACITHNAAMLAGCRGDFPIIIAGNRNAAAACEKRLAGRQIIRCPNVMPRLNQPEIEPVQAVIRTLFLERIIQAKGLSRESALVEGILMPTPSAVKRAVELLSTGTRQQRGLGELVAVDLGGATTDIYSVAEGMPEHPSTLLKGMVEPRSKRTVEGDIGMRYSAGGVLATFGAQKLAELSGQSEAEIAAWVANLDQNPDALPQNEAESAMDFALAAAASLTAVARHAGSLEQIYTLAGPALVQTGKELRPVKALVLTGGAIIASPRAAEVGACACYSESEPMSLRPRSPDIYVDRQYILAAMGLLADSHPAVALAIMKQEIIRA